MIAMNLKKLMGWGSDTKRRRAAGSLAAVEICESRCLLSAKGLECEPKGDEPKKKDRKQNEERSAAQKEVGGSYDGIWYIYLDGRLQGNVTLVQEGKEVKSLTNTIFTSELEGKVKGKKLKLSTETQQPGSDEDVRISWKVSLTNPNHFSGEQTVKGKGSKTTGQLDGDTSII